MEGAHVVVPNGKSTYMINISQQMASIKNMQQNCKTGLTTDSKCKTTYLEQDRIV